MPAAASMAAHIMVAACERGTGFALDGHVMVRALMRKRCHPHAGMQIWVIPAGGLILHSRTTTLSGNPNALHRRKYTASSRVLGSLPSPAALLGTHRNAVCPE